MVCSNLTAAQGGPRTDKEAEVQGGWTTLSGHPGRAKALGGTMAPTNGLPGFVPEGH